MTTRQTIPKPGIGESQLPNGFSGSDQPSDFYIPPCGIEDVDRAVCNLFDKEFGFTIQKYVNGQNKPVNIKKPTVIFATGERFAIVKKLRPVRDRNGALMLPAISIRRTSIDQTSEDMNSRGINQTTGELIIKRRLDSSDAGYQNLVNKLSLQNATDLPATERTQGENRNDRSIAAGMLLDPKLGNNVWEVIAIPQPQFFSATYEIIYWTSFTGHMNYMIETTLAAQLPQGKMFKLVTDKGYWFIATLEETATSQENFEDFTEDERVIRYSFELKVKAFLLVNNGPGTSVPFKKYISAPQISFDVQEGSPSKKADIDRLQPDKQEDRFALSDLEASPPPEQTLSDQIVYERSWRNPQTGRTGVGYVKAVQRGMRRGETVYTATDPGTLEEFLLTLQKPE